MKKLRIVSCIVLLAAFMLSACSGGGPSSSPAGAASSSAPEFKYSFKLTTPLGQTHLSVEYWTKLFADLEAKTGGRLNGRVYPTSQLANGNMMTAVDMIQKGTIDLGAFGSPLLSGYVAEMRLPTTPFLFDSSEQVDRVLNSKEVMDYFRRRCAASNFYFLGWMENSWNEISNSKRELVHPQDMRGLKMRVAANDLVSEAFVAAGASVVDMSLSELYTALQQGVVDGEENGVSGAFYANKLYEVQKYLLYCQYSYNAFSCVMNKTLWDSIPAGDQALITQLFDIYGPGQVQANRDSMEKNLKFVEDYGVVVHRMTPAEREEWKTVMGPDSATIANLLKTYDQEFVNILLNAR
ncbi:MAG: TRAP transporter substrate-binding protein [Spirochaetales bacterium]|nr:TRAP transporter substrate-binding protein [Spirochaetales bacterium]